MKFNATSSIDEVDINLTPLIDVVFLLLIFFMVSTTFDTTSQLKVKLPQASLGDTRKPTEPMRLVIDPKGHFFLNSRELANNHRATLEAALESRLGGRDLPIVLQSDASAPVQALVTAMDVVGQIGLSKVSIATTHAVE